MILACVHAEIVSQAGVRFSSSEGSLARARGIGDHEVGETHMLSALTKREGKTRFQEQRQPKWTE